MDLDSDFLHNLVIFPSPPGWNQMAFLPYVPAPLFKFNPSSKDLQTEIFLCLDFTRSSRSSFPHMKVIPNEKEGKDQAYLTT